LAAQIAIAQIGAQNRSGIYDLLELRMAGTFPNKLAFLCIVVIEEPYTYFLL
jgi:hypothetical protein